MGSQRNESTTQWTTSEVYSEIMHSNWIFTTWFAGEFQRGLNQSKRFLAMIEYLPILLFAAVFLLILFGYPVAFTLGGLSVMVGLIVFDSDFFFLLSLRVYGTMQNFVLLAVPLFIFMGMMLEKSGIAERLLHTMSMLFGNIRGGLAVAVIVVGAMLAASTGIVGATVVTMGLISLPNNA